MKRTLIFISVVLVSITVGFLIGKENFEYKSVNEEETKTKTDTSWTNAEIRLENRFPTYAVSGGLPDEKDKYRYIVDNWYNFRFVVSGTSCTDINNQTVDINHNNRTDSILKKRIGKNWKEKFEKSVDSLYKIDSLAMYIAEKDISVKNVIKQKTIQSGPQYTQYKCYPTTNSNLKIVSVEWRGLIYKDSTKVSFLRAIVDLKGRKVKEIEKTEKEADFFNY
ncbi:hypothetical protein [Flavobacterium sp. UBA7680]|uniref:hypothetical protein n=1 Tax=Flavobacterium sp. UBA7680 TaxID=1946559 RepID=UPI0025C73003|nr:hypothetical protein [Flavobacterium sp. UBA7680]